MSKLNNILQQYEKKHLEDPTNKLINDTIDLLRHIKFRGIALSAMDYCYNKGIEDFSKEMLKNWDITSDLSNDYIVISKSDYLDIIKNLMR